ncbi:3-deoxy-D-manno-octulosonic acid transferase [Glaciecola sp. SC05]|uniref:3-deoxy-D-manno-octulosonic acid transferase n=1 Tax=Glaciecola sp. SC05 TaxID=1987355 RepID=UPI003529D15F
MMAHKKETFAQTLYRWLYSLFLIACLPLLLLLFKKKLRMDPNYSGQPRKFNERFGCVPTKLSGGGILVHCVSMGELNASVQLVNRLQENFPELPITVTTTSTTGAMHAYTLYKDSVQHLFLPIDIPFFMHSFFNKLKPKLVLVTEVEIWPNMIHQCVKRDIPLCLINARLSDESLPMYQKLSFLLRPALRQFDVICAQSQSSYDNFTKMGVYKPQLKLTLNMKFDIEPSQDDEVKATLLKDKYGFGDGPIWLAASTHEPEEKFVLNVFAKLLTNFPTLRLILVPRHPHRFDDVYLIAKATGLTVTRLSDDDRAQAQVTVVDQMGWLKACYCICSQAFIGGSIAQKGGHNALECAMYAKPMVMGTSIFNNPGIVEMLKAQGSLDLIESEEQCFERLKDLLLDANINEAKGQAGLAVLLNNRGAVEMTYQQVTDLL